MFFIVVHRFCTLISFLFFDNLYVQKIVQFDYTLWIVNRIEYTLLI